MKKRIRIQGAIIFFSVIAAIVLSRVIVPRWENETRDELSDMAGLLFVLSGFLFRITARGHKEEHSKSGQALVRNGPYALVRHPMYFGTFLIGMGITMLLFEAWAFFIFLTVYLSIYIPQIKKEETILSKRFAGEYASYSREVPLYFPTAGALRTLREHLSFKVAWIKKELPSLLVVLSGIVAGEIYEDVRLFGHHETIWELLELVLILIVTLALIALLFKRKNAS